jgi:hypothetical protein
MWSTRQGSFLRRGTSSFNSFLIKRVTGDFLRASNELEDRQMAKFALYVSLKAKPGKEKDVEAFLKQGAEMSKAEAQTVNWYGLHEGEGLYSVFDTFNEKRDETLI